jgi:hypothetical protein
MVSDLVAGRGHGDVQVGRTHGMGAYLAGEGIVQR